MIKHSARPQLLAVILALQLAGCAASAPARLEPSVAATADVIRRLVDANNRADTEAFLALFSPDAKIYRASSDANTLTGVLSDRMSNPDSRRSVIASVFARGSPGQAQILDILTVGDLVVSHDRVTLPDGRRVDQIKIYRVREGLITQDWTAYEQAQ